MHSFLQLPTRELDRLRLLINYQTMPEGFADDFSSANDKIMLHDVHGPETRQIED